MLEFWIDVMHHHMEDTLQETEQPKIFWINVMHQSNGQVEISDYYPKRVVLYL